MAQAGSHLSENSLAMSVVIEMYTEVDLLMLAMKWRMFIDRLCPATVFTTVRSAPARCHLPQTREAGGVRCRFTCTHHSSPMRGQASNKTRALLC